MTRAYDYLLAVGPGRSGSTFLYRLLDGRAGFVAPSIKEGRYYRSPRRLARALERAGREGAILLDVANLAWSDPALARVAGLAGRGHRVLAVVLLRRHRDRAVSMLDFRRSRAGPFAGRRRLERAVLADSLTPPALERIFGLGVDVLTIGFGALTGDTGRVLEELARLCGTPPVEPAATPPANPSMRARSTLLAGAARLLAILLRGAGAHRGLQWLKDRPGVTRALFRPLRDGERSRLGPRDEAALDALHAACLRTVEAACEPLGEGLWLRRARPGLDQISVHRPIGGCQSAPGRTKFGG